MGINHRNVPWFVSAHTTAAGIALEYSGGWSSLTATTSGSGAQFGSNRRKFRLRGYSVSGSTAVVISTTPIKIIYGDSTQVSAHTTKVLCNDPGIGMIGVSGIMGIEAEYMALETTVSHSDGGLTFCMWGD